MEKMTLPEWMTRPGPQTCQGPGKGRQRGFVEKSLRNFAGVVRDVFSTEAYTGKDAFLQRTEPRFKLAGFFFLILAAAFSERWFFLISMLLLAFCLSIATKVGAGPLARRALPAVIFTAVLAAPALFGFVTPGTELLGSGGLALTREGVHTALFFVLRVSVMASIASLAVLTTAQADFFRGMGRLVPGFFATALFFTLKYVLILVKAAEDAALARRSRTFDRASVREAQRWFASRAAFLLKRSLNTAEEVSMAMISRGFDGRFRSTPAGKPAVREFFWLGATSFILFLSFGF